MIPRQVLQEDENDPTPTEDSQARTLDTHQKGQKRGTPIGDQKHLQSAPKSSTNGSRDNIFEDQYSQRRRRLRQERKQEMENLSAYLTSKPGISNHDVKRQDQLANMQTKPGKDGLEWVNDRLEYVNVKQHKAKDL